MKGPGKGHTNNPKGKPKGTLNRTTREAREMLEKVLYKRFDSLDETLDKIEKSEDKSKYIESLNKLLQYVLPKKTDVTSDDKPLLSNLPDIVIKSKDDN